MFQSGKELEAVYSTEAAFYKLKTDERTYLCRSLASITRTGKRSVGADALFVLLNPGKCLPVEGEDSVPFLSGGPESVPLLPAVPDNTLHQVMRLMERMNWNHVRIINLTDVRTGKFSEYQEHQRFMEANGDMRHSIFAAQRRSELASVAEGAKTLIVGWGTKSSIRRAADEACTALSELGPISGLPFRTHPLYYHPFPWIQGKCIQWLDRMEEQLKEAVETVQ